jgi:DNA-binding transcriptional LysR family regulator
MPAALDIQQLRTFLTIAETGSFGRAARALDRTQAALSQQMQLLEGRVGKHVFDRDSSGSRLTEEGWRLVTYARRLVQLSEETSSAFDDEETARSAVRFASTLDYFVHLDAILARFRQSQRDVEVSVICTTSPFISEMAWSGEIDLGLVTNRCPAEVEVVHDEALVWVASKEHRPETMDVIPLAVADRGCPWRRAALESLAAAGRPSRIAFVSANARAIAAVVMRGLAVTLLGESTADPQMRVVESLMELSPLPRSEIGIMRSWRRPPTAAASGLAKAVRDVFRDMRPPREPVRGARRPDAIPDLA